MPESSPTALNRIVSDGALFRPPLLIASICALVASAALAVIVICAGVLALILTDSTGVTPFAIVLSERLPILQDRSTALVILTIAIAAFAAIRLLMQWLANGVIGRRVSFLVNRQREHIQRFALRANPGDLTGAERSRAAALFRTTAQTLQKSAQQWASLRVLSFCDLFAMVVVVLLVQWRVGLECLIPIFVCWYVGRKEAGRHEASSHLLADQVERGLDRLTEDLNKARIVAGYGMEKIEHQQFADHLQKYQQRSDRLQKQQERSEWVAWLITLVMVLLPGYLIARHVLSAELVTVPSAVMLALAAFAFTKALKRLQVTAGLHGAASVAAEEISQYLLQVPSVSQTVGARFLEPMSRLLQFDQVSVDLPEHPDLLAGLDLKISAGQRVALLSLDSLEAKSLMSLIPRLSDPTAGQVLIDGQDIRRVTLESLRAEAMIVGGSEPVFRASILDNVLAGQTDLTRQQAIDACKMAHAESFIRQLPGGYEAELGGDAVSLTTGQLFRLSLARAIVRQPALLVIEEPDSSLDSETKAMLDDTYERICSERTVIFLPSRLSTVKKCERVIVLRNGRVAADGPHEELVKSSEVYRHWEYQRFNAFADA